MFVSNPKGMDDKVRRRLLDGVRDLNPLKPEAIGDPEINTRIQSYEMQNGNCGRDHHMKAYSVWVAGEGVKKYCSETKKKRALE